MGDIFLNIFHRYLEKLDTHKPNRFAASWPVIVLPVSTISEASCQNRKSIHSKIDLNIIETTCIAPRIIDASGETKGKEKEDKISGEVHTWWPTIWDKRGIPIRQ